MIKIAPQTDMNKISAMCLVAHKLTRLSKLWSHEHGHGPVSASMTVSVELIRSAGPDQLVKWYDDFMASVQREEEELKELVANPEPLPPLVDMIDQDNHDILVTREKDV
ncbi:hypothetical protein [Delftia phage PhiW-14]|uniref:Uncharacterized protein n=1 Tax=Delftia phage PhiW-14 TaxID=665032 RepID=C9DG86_BPW14|nr:hypothetical protein DP-phiW-14_gp116 [Delftia phage PhiW-14]ACV50137.1 hypothetical protein [Delftia phage PhiW-14]